MRRSSPDCRCPPKNAATTDRYGLNASRDSRQRVRAGSLEVTLRTSRLARFAAGCVAGAAIAAVMLQCADTLAQGDKALEEIQKYRQMLEEGNPADLAEQSGRELWSARRGPKQAS